MTGKEIGDPIKFKVVKGENILKYDLQNINSGNYIIKISDGQKVTTTSFIVNK